VLELKGHTNYVKSVSFSPDGARLATGSADKTAQLWHARTGAPVLELKGHTLDVTSVSFSPDGTRLATGSWDDTARLWDARTGAPLLELKGHTNSVTSVSFSPDGTRLATGSLDKTARLWDARTGAPLLELKGHTIWVASVSFSPDGTRLASRMFDNKNTFWKTIVWDLKTGKAIADAPVSDWPDQDRARSHDGRWAAVVDGSRVRLVDLQQPPDDIELETRMWATRFDRYWHAEQMQQRAAAGEWQAALYYANQLLQRQPGDGELLDKRQAIAARAVKDNPRDTAALAAHARLLLAGDKLVDYRTACQTLRELAGDFKDQAELRRLAAACVPAPRALADLQPLLDAFKKSMSDKYPEDLRLYGGLLLRAGKAQEAIPHLEAARKLRDDTVYEDLLLALAYHQLKKPKEAKVCLDRAVFALDRQPAAAAAFNVQAGMVLPLAAAIGAELSILPDNYERAVGWQSWFELQVLRREAVKALP
jgi:hypothetical protein